MTREQLLARLRDPEDQFTERKPAGANRQVLRRTLVAFANSVAEGRTGVLYIGIGDKGDVQGVDQTDSIQKTIRDICESD